MRSGRGADFLHNPEAFLERAAKIVRDNRHALAIDGIKYIKLDGKEYYAQEIFDSAELIANPDRTQLRLITACTTYIVYDSSTIERPFAVA